jgi:lysophospholipase L1-like esterase
MKIKNYLLISLSVFIFSNLLSQDYPYAERKYNFIRYDKNKIDFPGDSSQFENLFYKLDQVIKTGEGKINIIHIGGSHIQAGSYTGVVRKKMQTFFPGLNGGRGLVFPYRMSKTNSPRNYRIRWTGEWETCRNVEKKSCELGLLGISATTIDPYATLHVTLSENYVRYDFNQIKIFNKIGDNFYKIIPEEIDCEYTVNEFPEAGYTLIRTEEYINELKLQIEQTDTLQQAFTLFGISLENDNPGVVYNDVGINGARIPSFLTCTNLEKETEIIQPDLVILSLGTNDTYTKNFRPDYYKSNYKQLIQSIRRAAPEAAILITVPNDSYYRRRDPNPNTALAEKMIFELANEQACGVWNFYRVMGGYNSSLLWLKEKLMHTDLIHFNSTGYTIKGELMFEALVKAYDNHIEENLDS